MNAFIKVTENQNSKPRKIHIHQQEKNQSPSQLPQNNLNQIKKVKTFILKANTPTKEIKKTLKRGKLIVLIL